jgi:hypothetical protein
MALDLPGAGEDQTPLGEVTLERYGERVCEALSETEPAVLLGQSMVGSPSLRRRHNPRTASPCSCTWLRSRRSRGRA